MSSTRTAAPRVAYQGEPGAFSEEAVHAFFGDGVAVAIGCREFEDIHDAVLNGTADLGILPLENSIAGRVAPAHRLLARGELRIIGEVVRPIVHCLLALPGSVIRTLREVRSHPVALAQCRRFLATLPHARAVPAYDTAGAAMLVGAGGDPAVAAIAGATAARRYGLIVLASAIQDQPENHTRFAIVRPAGAE